MIKVGDTIKIIEMVDEPQYNGRTGVVTYICKDPWGDVAIYGTWGGCSIYPAAGDRYTIIKNS